MRKSAPRVIPALVALLILSACKGTDITDPPVTTTVLVSSKPTHIADGENERASAAVKDQDENSLSGKSITWTSLNQSIATVTPAGVIRGVAAGNATIQGTVDGVTGTASVQVFVPPPVCAEGPENVSLAVGEVRVLNLLDIVGCAKLAAVAGQPQYIAVAANVNAFPDAFPTFIFRYDLGENV